MRLRKVMPRFAEAMPERKDKDLTEQLPEGPVSQERLGCQAETEG